MLCLFQMICFIHRVRNCNASQTATCTAIQFFRYLPQVGKDVGLVLDQAPETSQLILDYSLKQEEEIQDYHRISQPKSAIRF